MSFQGTFGRVKGVKTCTYSVTRVDEFRDSNLVLPPYNSGDIALPGAGYYGEWKQTDTYRDDIVESQKGKGAVEPISSSSTLVSRRISDLFCGESTDGFRIGFAFIVECEVAGVYPAEVG